MGLVRIRFESFGVPLLVDRNVIPPDDDPSTLFVCSGMQKFRRRYLEPDGGEHGSIQSCIRTNDLELVGDGSHLSYFEMLGNFSFGGRPYGHFVELWHVLLRDLSVPVTHVTCHPSQDGHRRLWAGRGYEVVPDEGCTWSDGEIGGFCCEVFVGGLEVGNLVNTLGVSTDVGFGWERLLQVVEGKPGIHETTAFRQDLPPVAADHLRALEAMRENGIEPGPRGRGYVCRRLVQRMLPLVADRSILPPHVAGWMADEERLREERLATGARLWRRHRDKPPEFWRESLGLTPEDLRVLRDRSGR